MEMQKPNVDMQPGDVVFFTRCKKSVTPGTLEVAFKDAHGFGVILGMIPKHQKDPTAHAAMQCMGSVGYLAFDDIAEFLGEEQMKVCMTKFEEKYYAAEVLKEQKENVVEVSPILNVHEQPMGTGPTGLVITDEDKH